MSETKWEYLVMELGSTFRGAKTEKVEATLNELGEDGWEVFHIRQPQGGNKLFVTAKRPLTTRSRRRRSLPGERW